MKVFLSELAQTKLIDLLKHIETKWGKLVRDNFLNKFIAKKNQISQQPYSCPQSHEVKGLFKCVVSKQTTFFYRITNNQIEIITVFDTRQNPERLTDEL